MIQVLNSIEETRAWVKRTKAEGYFVHLVPTMGYFHEGHLSLIRAADATDSAVIVSLFVNPMQFGPNEDLSRYPRDFDRDLQMAEEAGAAAMFAPEAAEIYPDGFQTVVSAPELSKGLCGDFRPGHFDGVATVVAKLFNIVQPDRAFFGEKDFQQLQVIRRMTSDLNLPLEIVPCPTVREADGLAMSSRNVYLSPDERAQAPTLYAALRAAAEAALNGEKDAETLKRTASERVGAAPLAKLQYLELVDAETLKPIARLEAPAVMAVAAHFGSTRLIDNLRLEPSR